VRVVTAAGRGMTPTGAPAQFHDAAWQFDRLVYDELREELAKIVQRELRGDYRTVIRRRRDELFAFNPLPVPRTVIVDRPDDRRCCIFPLGGARIDDAQEEPSSSEATSTLLESWHALRSTSVAAYCWRPRNRLNSLASEFIRTTTSRPTGRPGTSTTTQRNRVCQSETCS
jgi:hypothetical protein